MSNLARIIRLEKFARPNGDIGNLTDGELDGLITTLRELRPDWPVSAEIISMSMADLGFPLSPDRIEALLAETA
jgi:hypothetical protein